MTNVAQVMYFQFLCYCAVGLRENVKRGDVTLAGAEVLMTLECTLNSKFSKATLAEEFMIIMCSNVTE